MVVYKMIKVAIVTLVFILFDILTGFLKAAANHNIDSTALRKGLLHKLSEVVAIVFAFLCEYAVQYIHLGVEIPLVIAVCGYIIIMEIISVLENIVEVNPELGKFFAKYLSKLKEVQENGSTAYNDQQEGK